MTQVENSSTSLSTSSDQVIWTGRGVTAMTIALRNAVPKNSGVLVPVNICSIAIAGILSAGMRPVFHDVSEEHGNADVSHLESVAAAECSVLMATHNFGRPVDMDAFCAFSRKHDLFLLEDVCNALGASFDGQPLGSFGEAAIYSFNTGKIVDAGGGGALTVKDPGLRSRCAADLASQPLFSGSSREQIDVLEGRLRSARTQNNLTLEKNALEAYLPFSLFRHGTEFEENIWHHISSLAENVAHRISLSNIYRESLSSPKLTHAPRAEGEVPWRHTILVPEDLRDNLVDHMRNNDCHASTWYPPIHKVFSVKDTHHYPGAERFSKRVINLWVDQKTTIDEALRTSRIIEAFLEVSHT